METFLATTGRIFLRLLELHGIDADRFVRDGGHAPEVFRDPAARLPSSVVDVAARAAAARIPDPAFALRAARCWHPSDLGALGFAWLASSTLRTALQRLERYGRILGENARGSGWSRVTRVCASYSSTGARTPLVAALGTDYALSIVMDMCRMNFGASLRPLEVTLCRERPADPAPWENFFGVRVHFDAARNSLRSRARTPTRRCRCPTGRSPARWTASWPRSSRNSIVPTSRRAARRRCSSAWPRASPSTWTSPRSLHMSRRTLQRKLAEADLTYQQLVDDTRRDLALRYIEDPGRSLTEITFLLGFSGQSAFTRAFRRWTGTAPTDFRARQARRAA